MLADDHNDGFMAGSLSGRQMQKTCKAGHAAAYNSAGVVPTTCPICGGKLLNPTPFGPEPYGTTSQGVAGAAGTGAPTGYSETRMERDFVELAHRAIFGELDADARNDLPGSKFAYIDSKGGKHLPIHDEGHVRAALGRFNQTQFEDDSAKAKTAKKIASAAGEHGIKIDPDSAVGESAGLKMAEGLRWHILAGRRLGLSEDAVLEHRAIFADVDDDGDDDTDGGDNPDEEEDENQAPPTPNTVYSLVGVHLDKAIRAASRGDRFSQHVQNAKKALATADPRSENAKDAVGNARQAMDRATATIQRGVAARNLRQAKDHLDLAESDHLTFFNPNHGAGGKFASEGDASRSGSTARRGKAEGLAEKAHFSSSGSERVSLHNQAAAIHSSQAAAHRREAERLSSKASSAKSVAAAAHARVARNYHSTAASAHEAAAQAHGEASRVNGYDSRSAGTRATNNAYQASQAASYVTQNARR